ncbi:UDP-glucuronic acid decarboxylase family protein [Chelativorans alearense]|uniref:UDP-glucuronic acid decarboxylase family protein n=1 Tax=Chelativorans alearense TaxID=2681495 RepID=UPI0013D8BBB3|nr:UDP-glucuronic acid decarboxylase family protein [Chelativorans alearense]
MKTVLIAGGAGFLGSHLCEAILREGNRVICVDSFLTGARANVVPWRANDRFKLIEKDICMPIEIGERIDEIYNLACAASPPRYRADPVHTMMSSVLGTHNLLRLAERKGATFLQASTSEVYGDPQEHPQNEDYCGSVNCTGPRACYDEGKRAAEALCFDFLRLNRANVRVARIFNTYGPRMQPDDGRIVSTFICQALSGAQITVHGSGEQTRSFCYVSDLVHGLILLMRKPQNPGQPINLGNPGEFTVKELIDLLAQQIGTRPEVMQLPMTEDDPQRRRPDIHRAQAILGWEPRVPLEEGLRRTISWFQLTTRRHGGRRPAKRPATEPLIC